MNRDGEKWKIYWNDYMVDAYVYGNEVSFKPGNEVEIHNNLIPAGTVLKTWYSKTNFQSQKIEPSLPIIDGEGSYSLTLDVETDVTDGVLLKLLFFDRYDIQIGQMIIRDKETEFRCPLATYSYCMQLVLAGARHVIFRNVVIQELENEPADDVKQTESNTEEGKETQRENE